MFSFLWKVIWRVKATMKVAFFVCIAALEKILLIVNLVKWECLKIGERECFNIGDQDLIPLEVGYGCDKY